MKFGKFQFEAILEKFIYYITVNQGSVWFTGTPSPLLSGFVNPENLTETKLSFRLLEQ